MDELTHHSLEPLRPPYSSRPRLSLEESALSWLHLKCSGLQNAAQYRRTKDWACSSCNSPPAPSQPQAPPPPTQTTIIDAHFSTLQWNANGIGNKIGELRIFMEKHTFKVAVIQESKLSQTSSIPCIQNYTTVRKDRRLGHGGGLLTFIHKSINYSRKPESPETLGDPHLEELSISARLGNTDLIIYNIYIPPTSSCTGARPSDDDDGHPTAWRLQCSPLIMALIFNRYETQTWRTRSTAPTSASSTGTPPLDCQATPLRALQMFHWHQLLLSPPLTGKQRRLYRPDHLPIPANQRRRLRTKPLPSMALKYLHRRR